MEHEPIFLQLSEWQEQGIPAALATVVKVYGSAPRPLGAKMAVSAEGAMVGSVSGGCVESAVVQQALAVIDEDRPRLVPFGIGDDWAQSVGLACGGQIEVFISPWHGPLLSWDGVQTLATATVLSGPQVGARAQQNSAGEQANEIHDPQLAAAARQAMQAALADLQSRRLTIDTAQGPVELFVEALAPKPHLIIIGAVHIAQTLVEFARRLGFLTTVIDPRPAFATPQRFPHADRLLCQWPQDALPHLNLQANAYVVVISHDDKLDLPALAYACRHRPRYIGAMGSRRTMAQRLQALRDEGLSEEELQPIKNPIGLPIGAATPAEIALAIMAEVVAVWRGVSSLQITFAS